MFSLRRNPDGSVDKFKFNFAQFGDIDECVSYDVAGLSAGTKIYVHSAIDEVHIPDDPNFTWRTVVRVVSAGVATEVRDFHWGKAATFVLPNTGFVSVVVPAEHEGRVLLSAEGPTAYSETIVPI